MRRNYIFLLICIIFFSCKAQRHKEQLTFWHYWNDRNELIHKISDEYYSKTNIPIKIELYSGDIIGHKLLAAAAADNLPDVFSDWSGCYGRGLISYVKSGKIVNLKQYFSKEELEERFDKDVISQIELPEDNMWGVPAGIYYLPLDVNNMLFIYNKNLFRKAGLNPEQPPRDWQEFLDVCRQLKSSNIYPLVLPFGGWVLMAFVKPYIYNHLGINGVQDTAAGKLKYTDERWRNVFMLMKTLVDEKFLFPGSLSFTTPDAERMFVAGKAAITFDGSWAIKVFEQIDKSFTDYGVFFPPKDKNGKYEPLIPGGIGAAVFVANNKNKELSINFVKYLTNFNNQTEYYKFSYNLPPNKKILENLPGTQQMKKFNKYFCKIIPFRYDIENLEEPRVIEALKKNLQLVLLGEKNVDDALIEIQKLKDEYMRDKK